MYLDEPSHKHHKLIIAGIMAVTVALFAAVFWRELRDLFLMIAELPDGFTAPRLESLHILFYTALTFVVFAGLWVILVAGQALLPATTLQEKWRTTFQFVLFILGQHGPAVFVKDGQVLSNQEDRRDGPGVVVIDFNSAVVLEERLPPPGLGSGFENGFHRLLWTLGLADKAESPRVMGPGIAFTRSRERIRGAVDLRQQIRLRQDVRCYSRDGIEVAANVWAIFTIGQPPDVLEVAYDGETKPERLRVVSFERVSDGYLRFGGFSDELDVLDQQEIHHQAHVFERTHQFAAYQDLPPAERMPVFDPDRVFRAVYSQARSESERVLPWSELPLHLASEIFRGILSQVNYDLLYQLGSADPLPLLAFRDQLRDRMRNNGLLAYRVVRLKAQTPFELHHVYRPGDLLASPAQALTTPKILRERGIKVIASGFGDILPVSQAVYDHRLESWRAPWERDQAVVNAASEREAMHVRARGRALAQQDLVTHLNTIISTTQNSEVLVVRLLQALETVGADAQTRQLLPADTIALMRHVRELLTQGEPTPPYYGNPPLGGGAP